jgi:hypothetical protein
MTDELHPIQREMLRLEAAIEHKAPPPGPPIDACIAELVDFNGDLDGELDPLLFAEAKRAVRLANGHYREWADVTPLTVAAIGFMQGVTFARAVRNVKEVTHD